jgi:hypothetical protein
MKHARVVLEEQYKKALYFIEDENIRKFVYFALVDYAPLSFWEIPAAFSAACHNETEKAIGEIVVNGDEHCVVKLGGKAWHTLRVLNIAKTIIESDEEKIWDFRKTTVKGHFVGNEMHSLYADICYASCLLHDIYSLCEGLEWRNAKHRGMDKEHPYYHRTDLDELAKRFLSKDVWDFMLKAIESHMWKWSPKPEVIPRRRSMLSLNSVEQAYNFSEMYRVIEYVHIADLIAAQKDFTGF